MSGTTVLSVTSDLANYKQSFDPSFTSDKKIVKKTLTLSFGLAFDDIYAHEGLAKIDSIFLKHLEETSPSLHERLVDARRNPSALAAKPASELIVELAPYVEDFIGTLFGIESELRELQARHHELAPLYSVKRKFVQRKALDRLHARESLRDRRLRGRRRTGSVSCSRL